MRIYSCKKIDDICYNCQCALAVVKNIVNFHTKKCKDVAQLCSFVTIVFKFDLKFKLPKPEGSRNIENGNRESKNFNNRSN